MPTYNNRNLVIFDDKIEISSIYNNNKPIRKK